MIGDKQRFENMKDYEGGSVRFGNNGNAKIVWKGTVKLGDSKVKIEDILFVIGLKHNLLSVSQICDKGNDIIFKRHSYEIRRSNTRKLVAYGTRTSRNIYTLS